MNKSHDMDIKESKTLRKNILTWLILPLTLLLAGCDLKITDLTPSSMKANPSNVYTITAQVAVTNSAVKDGTVKPEIIIDGKAYPMVEAPGAGSLYEFDYKMPRGQSEAAYYLLVSYERKTTNGFTTKEAYTELTNISIQRRYSVDLEVDRAPVGTKVAILGRGFAVGDKVIVGETPAVSRLESATALAFYVPTMPEGRNYEVKVLGSQGEISAGFIRIDSSQIRVSPSSISMSSGGRRPMVFSIPEDAPPGGLRVDVTTDVPASIIMPEVIIPAGQRSVSVTLEGGEPAEGSIFVEVPGYNEVVLPVTIN
ncbi:hypothetical protein MLD52_00725 [Puniceicoccaceae bacterium K14]|nr:hypothetical protein [Puniceicoccaceae bacterium K14]